MRELKFRGWQPIQPHQSVDRGYVYSDDCDDLESFFRCCGDEIIEQFTGLLDKNGKPIYEGDVVRLGPDIYELWYDPGQIVLIEWDNDDTGFKPFQDGHSDYNGVSSSQCEIIGTIHDAEYKELAK